MSTIKICVAITAIILFSKQHTSLEARSLKFRHCTSSFNPKYFSNFTLYALNDSLSSESVLIKPLGSGLKSNVEIQIRLTNSKNYQTLFGYTFDVCSMVVSLKDTSFKRFLKSVLKHSNSMQNCPFLEGHYYVKAWSVDPSLIPTYLYSGEYRLKSYSYIDMKNKKDFVVKSTIDAEIEQN